MKNFLVVFFAALIFSSVAGAENFKPGSIGYLYQSCKTALEKSAAAKDFDVTYCGGFVEGYIAGVAATYVDLPPPSPADPCAAEKKKEFSRINNRFCANLPDYKNMSLVDINSIAPKAAAIFFRWIDYLKSRKSTALKLPMAAQLNSMLGQGRFCDGLGKDAVISPSNPDMQKFNLLEYVELQRSKTVASEYAACAADIKTGKPFVESRCGAEITGFITGALSLQDVQAGKPRATNACGKEIARLYKDIDASKTMCLSRDTDPAAVAKIFLKSVNDSRAASINAARADDPGFGAAGYRPIYFGLLCHKK